jgi:Fe-S cluster assembly protein SufD
MEFDFKNKIINEFDKFAATLNGEKSKHLFELRKQSLAAFDSKGIPTRKHEEWRYTPLAFLNKYDFVPVYKPDSHNITREIINDLKIDEKKTVLLVFVNGFFSEELSNVDKSGNDNVYIGSLRNALAEREQIEDMIGKTFENNDDAFVNLNTAYARDGACVIIPKNEEFEKTVQILSVVDATDFHPLVNLRNIISAGENSNVKIVETCFIHGNNVGMVNTVTEITVADYAFVNYYKYQREIKELYNFGTTNVIQENASQFESNVITLRSKFVRNTMNVKHNARHCQTSLNGLYFIKDDDFADNHTLIDHAKPDGKSTETYKGILDGKSTAVFSGKVLVRPDAQHTESYQSNKNILLSNDATVNTKPQLEIFADDVKCSHGATSGSIEEMSLFYLRARGIGRGKALSLLLNAFAVDVIDKITIPELREKIRLQIASRLGISKEDICYSIDKF